MKQVSWVLPLMLLTAGVGCKSSTRAMVPEASAAQAKDDRRPIAQAAAQPAVVPGGPARLEDVEERKGPFVIAGQSFTALLHYKRLAGSEALASLEIRDAAGEVQYREAYEYTVENGAFGEMCSAGIEFLKGSNGSGLLIDSGCLPSAPMSGGPWEILGVVQGKLARLGKPLVTEGEMGGFVAGAITKAGALTQILPDVLKIRVWTGYFFATVPVRVDWLGGKLALAQHCYYQTGRGLAEEGCEMPAENVERAPADEDMTFVRLFGESNERGGPPAHVVVKKDSKVEILAGKALVTWDEGKDAINLSVGDDIWVKVRIDGREGWIHTAEDLNAIGLSASG